MRVSDCSGSPLDPGRENSKSLSAADVKFLLVPPQQAEPQQEKELIDLLQSQHDKKKKRNGV